MMNNTIKRTIAICGLDCSICDAYIATKNNDQALREKTVFYANHPVESTREIATTLLHSATYCSHIKKQHDFYLRGMEQVVKVLRKQIDKCKRLMNVTDEAAAGFPSFLSSMA